MQTAMEQHIEVMKKELLNMYQNDIRFGMLLKLIRKADELLDIEQKQIKLAFLDGQSNVMDARKDGGYKFTDHNHYFRKQYENEEVEN
jgi:hypothetical protein